MFLEVQTTEERFVERSGGKAPAAQRHAALPQTPRNGDRVAVIQTRQRDGGGPRLVHGAETVAW